MLKPLALSLAVASSLSFISTSLWAEDFKILKQLENKPTLLKSGEYKGHYYVPSTLNTITWGYLPNKDAKPVLTSLQVAQLLSIQFRMKGCWKIKAAMQRNISHQKASNLSMYWMKPS